MHSHIMIIPFDCEGETALYVGLITTWRRISQCTTSKHCFLLLIEADGAEFLPVAHELIFDDKVMDSEFSLRAVSINLLGTTM